MGEGPLGAMRALLGNTRQLLSKKIIYQNKLLIARIVLIQFSPSLFLPNDGIAEDLLLEKRQMIQNTHCYPYVGIIEVILPHLCFAAVKKTMI